MDTNKEMEIDLQNRIAIAVRTLRVSKGLSQKDLADATGLTQAAISLTERRSTKAKKARMNLTTVKKIADALQISLWKLIREAESCDVSQAVPNLERVRRRLG